MSRIADIIPIESRRHGPAVVSPRPAPPTAGPEKGARIIAALCLLAFPAAVFFFVETGAHSSVTALGPTERAAVFQRAYDDLRATCGLPEATDGALRDRCRSTASFVVLFPECDAACGRAARALMPQARR